MTLALPITGSRGQLGGELVSRAHRTEGIPFARGIDLPEVDLPDAFAVRDTVQEWHTAPALLVPTCAPLGDSWCS